MTVDDLIKKLQQVKNKNLPIQILGSHNKKIKDKYGNAISINDVGDVINFNNYVAITRIIQ